MGAEGDFTWHPNASRYEFATRNQAGFGGWAESLRWLDSLGWEKVHSRVSQLSAHASGATQHLAKFQLVSPSELFRRNGIVWCYGSRLVLRAWISIIDYVKRMICSSPQ